jgi:transcriptional regulator with XRE-family HTH domain
MIRRYGLIKEMKYELPKMLKQARKAKGISFTDLDRETKISRAYLCQLENGLATRPSFEIVFTLATYFKIAPEILYYGKIQRQKVETKPS